MWTRVNDIDRLFGSMDLLRSRLNRLYSDFESYQEQGYGWPFTDGTPRTNLYEAGDRLEIKAEVPGMGKEDLTVRIQGKYLEISGTRKADTPAGYKAHRLERRAANFTRSFTLPSEVNAEKVEATLQNGILTLTLPKSEAAKPKTITIN